ncbi:quinidine resistance protein-like protein [Coprinopsis sp. MPI-PUGE-AT-0042]|nr:quinidine resistance protein-like protein [Coprinopsis sp. MPI-PUGE-AT-0042]
MIAESKSPSHVNAAPHPAAVAGDQSKVGTISGNAEKPSEPEEPFSVFSRAEKWLIVSLTALAGLFSPLTANIYFPSLPSLSRDFHKSLELINLTVTMYMIFQGISPMIWGPLADSRGRRPVYIACLTTLALSCVALALVPTSAYWLLMLLRCFQAAGSASTIALGAGVIGDISTREERAGFFGVFTVGPMIGPAIGPVIGGVLAGSLGWRSIFWFLVIASSACCLVMLCLLPETLRSLVGNGSIRPSRIYRPLLPIIPRKSVWESARTSSAVPAQKASGNPFRLFRNVDIIILLCLNAILNSVLYGVMATLSTALEATYPFLTESTIGVSFLACGGGMTIGSVANGWVLDHEYQKFKRSVGTESRDVFPIERARLRLLPIVIFTLTVATAGYGWALQTKVNIAVPLILNIFVGYGTVVGMNSTSTLMIDLFPDQGSSITACNNLVRCIVAAGLVSGIQPMINAIGYGWTFVFIAGLAALAVPLLFLQMYFGPRFRLERYKRSQDPS